MLYVGGEESFQSRFKVRGINSSSMDRWFRSAEAGMLIPETIGQQEERDVAAHLSLLPSVQRSQRLRNQRARLLNIRGPNGNHETAEKWKPALAIPSDDSAPPGV